MNRNSSMSSSGASGPFGMPPFDPSKMDPKLLMELSQLIQQLPPDQLSRMQTLMHNMMAGFDVRKDMEDFEKSLPPAFRIRMATLLAGHAGSMAGSFDAVPAESHEVHSAETASLEPDSNSLDQNQMDIREARITILRAVSEGQMTPEDALKLLFKEDI